MGDKQLSEMNEKEIVEMFTKIFKEQMESIKFDNDLINLNKKEEELSTEKIVPLLLESYVSSWLIKKYDGLGSIVVEFKTKNDTMRISYEDSFKIISRILYDDNLKK